ncbi:hypothetical protein KJ632_03630, partial [Patescibacteria group bacterium]|nr:hypothetical protein [Patescibacteria group bacterium]
MKTCLDCQKSFEISEEDFSRYEKLQVPEPARCVECRRKLRLAHWPYGIWQKRKCDATGESIISTYSSEARFPVYKREYWFSDKWDASVAEIDWGKSFFDQLFELQSKTPHFHQQGKQNENCDYADDVWECRNCYMSRSMAGCEDLSYCYRVLYCKSSLDLTYCYYTEQSYECTYCFKCYDVRFSFDCKE